MFLPDVTPECFHAVIYTKFVYLFCVLRGRQTKILNMLKEDVEVLGNDDFSRSFTSHPFFMALEVGV